MSKSQRRGFTLIELLVVIAIIGVLVGLLLPAVQAAREAARRTQCTSRLSQLAMAAIEFEGATRRLPAYQDTVAFVRGAPTFALTVNESRANKPASWAVQLLPYMERQDIYDRWNNPSISLVTSVSPVVFNSDMVHYLPFMVCPSSLSPDRTTASNTYVANTGFMPRTTDPAPYNTSRYLAVAQRSANGVFHDRRNLPKAQTTTSDIRDGLTNTLLFSENLIADGWPSTSKTGVGFVWIYASENGVNLHNSFATGAIITPTDVPPPVWAKINGDKGTVTGPPTAETARPSSNHPGGVVVAFADRHTQFMRESIEYHVYQQLMTGYSEKSDMPSRLYVLKSADVD